MLNNPLGQSMIDEREIACGQKQGCYVKYHNLTGQRKLILHFSHVCTFPTPAPFPRMHFSHSCSFPTHALFPPVQ